MVIGDINDKIFKMRDYILQVQQNMEDSLRSELDEISSIMKN